MHLLIFVLGVEDVDHSQVRLVRAGVDHAPGRPVGPAELARAEHVPSVVTSWKWGTSRLALALEDKQVTVSHPSEICIEGHGDKLPTVLAVLLELPVEVFDPELVTADHRREDLGLVVELRHPATHAC